MNSTGYQTVTNQTIAVTCILSVFFVVGTVGNALAFIIYYRKREKGTSTIFIIGLTVTDFLTCLIAIPYTITHELIAYTYSIDVFCRLYNFIITFNVPLSSLILVFIGFDRYFCICHPFLHVFTVPRAKRVIFFLTLISVLMGLVTALAHSIYYIEQIPVNITVPLNNTPSILINQLTPEISLPPSLSTASPTTAAADYLNELSTPREPSTSTRLFTEGLFLNPDSDFLNEMEHGDTITYKTGYTASDETTISSVGTARADTDKGNGLNYTIEEVLQTVIVSYEYCHTSDVTISYDIIEAYQIAYASLFLIEFIILAILYGLIYRSILMRRAWKARRKQQSSYSAPSCTEGEETQLTSINGHNAEVAVVKKNPSRISAAMRDKTFYANIRTAAMLFVVTAVFVVSFLPSWLMGLRVIEFNLIVFYVFYLNNVANPIIYAFMNRTFRDELVLLLKNCFFRR